MSAVAAGNRLLELAADVGRLRRRVDPDGYDAVLLARIAGHVDALDAIHEPTAADRVRAGIPVDDALELVDQRAQELERLLGGRS
jgi:hypothetical protein